MIGDVGCSVAVVVYCFQNIINAVTKAYHIILLHWSLKDFFDYDNYEIFMECLWCRNGTERNYNRTDERLLFYVLTKAIFRDMIFFPFICLINCSGKVRECEIKKRSRNCAKKCLMCTYIVTNTFHITQPFIIRNIIYIRTPLART